MKFRKISASVLAISLILTVNAAAYDNTPESSPASKPALQTSYDRSELTIEEERAIIEQWLEEYPDAVVGTSNDMLVLDTRPWSDFSTESAPACMPGFSMEEYQAEYSTPDEEIETIEEQPPELSLHDKMIIELFNGMNEEQRLEAIENDIVLELSMEARHMLLSCMTDTERETAILKYLKYDSNISVII